MTQLAAIESSIEWHQLGNVRLSRVTLARTLDLLFQWAGRPPFRLVVTPNVDHVVILQRSEPFREAYARAALSLVDGRPVQWAANYLGLPPFEKVSGSDLLPALCAQAAAAGRRVFFAGGRTPAELDECLARIRQRYPGLTLGGACPPFGFERDETESARLLGAIRAFGADFILLTCGSPKSEIWLARHGEALGSGVGLSIGAGLRMLAGLDRRAPRLLQRAGLEWFWRLSRDPRRLWRRYLVDDMRFFPLVWRWKREKLK